MVLFSIYWKSLSAPRLDVSRLFPEMLIYFKFWLREKAVSIVRNTQGLMVFYAKLNSVNCDAYFLMYLASLANVSSVM